MKRVKLAPTIITDTFWSLLHCNNQSNLPHLNYSKNDKVDFEAFHSLTQRSYSLVKWWWMKSPLWLPYSQIRCVNSDQKVPLLLLYTIYISQSPPKQQIKPAKLVRKAGEKKNCWEKMKSKQVFNRICKGVKRLPGNGARSKVAVRRSRCHILGAPRSLVSTLLTQADCPPGLPLPPFKWDRLKPQGSFLSLVQEVFTKGVAQPWSCGPVAMEQQAEVLAAAGFQDPFILCYCFSVLPHVAHLQVVPVQWNSIFPEATRRTTSM